MKKQILVLLFALLSIGAGAITIDNTHPFPATLIAGEKYEVLAGTIIKLNYTVNATNCKIYKVGIGANPIISNTAVNGFVFTKCQITNIDFNNSFAGFGIELNASSLIGGHYNGGYTGIVITGNCLIKDFELTGFGVDGIRRFTGALIDSVTIQNGLIHKANTQDGQNCETNGSLDNIHLEAIRNLLIDNIISDHSQYPGKFALIIADNVNVVIKNSTFFGWSYNTNDGRCIYIKPNNQNINFTNCNIIGGDWGVENNGNPIFTNCTFKGQKSYAVFQGLNKKFINCKFIDIGRGAIVNDAACIRSWANTTTVTNCKFYNCVKKYTGNGFVENGSQVFTTTLDTLASIRATPPIPNYKDSTFRYKAQADSFIIYRGVMQNIVIKGLKNTYQTKTSILTQITKVIKY